MLHHRAQHCCIYYGCVVWPIFQDRSQHNRNIYGCVVFGVPRSEHNTTVYITTIWPIFQHRTQHNRIYYNNMTDLPTPNTTQPYILQQRDGVLDFLFFKFLYILLQFSLIFLAFIFERFNVIVVPCFEAVYGNTYVAWWVGFCFYCGLIYNIFI